MTMPMRNKGGAPRGNQNRLVHGKYTREAIALRRRVRAHMSEVRALIADAKLLSRPDSKAPARCPSTDSPPRNHAGNWVGSGGHCCAAR